MHHLVAKLAVGEAFAVLVAGLDQHREDIPAVGPLGATSRDLAVDDPVEVAARPLHPRPRRAGAAEQHPPGLGVVEGERPLERGGRLVPDRSASWVEADQRPHRDAHREVADPVVDVDRRAGAPRLERQLRLVDHHPDRGVHPRAVERGHHDLAGPVVVLPIGGDQAVADQRNQLLAEHPLAPAEVVGARDGDEVVRLGPEHHHSRAVEHANREHVAVAPVVLERRRQRVPLEAMGAAQAEVELTGRQLRPAGELLARVRDHAPDPGRPLRCRRLHRHPLDSRV